MFKFGKNRSSLVPLLTLLATAAPTVAQTAVSSGFTYQGRLNLSGQPVDGSADLQFTLYDAAGNAYFSSEWVPESTAETVSANLSTGCVFTDGIYERRAIARLRVPEAGNYEAVSSARDVVADAGPVISFGHNGTRDFGYVLFVLAGGGLLAAILGVGTAIVARVEDRT